MNDEKGKYFIWISGAINSGKTTIANLLQSKVSNSVNIELGTLSAFDTNLSIDKKLNFIIQDGIDLAGNWIDRGFIPILNWPIYGDELSFMQTYSLQKELIPVLFNLIPKYESITVNRGGRELTKREIERIEYMYKICKMDVPDFGYSIDNSFLSPEETTLKIIKIMKERNY